MTLEYHAVPILASDIGEQIIADFFIIIIIILQICWVFSFCA